MKTNSLAGTFFVSPSKKKSKDCYSDKKKDYNLITFPNKQNWTLFCLEQFFRPTSEGYQQMTVSQSFRFSVCAWKLSLTFLFDCFPRHESCLYKILYQTPHYLNIFTLAKLALIQVTFNKLRRLWNTNFLNNFFLSIQVIYEPTELGSK